MKGAAGHERRKALMAFIACVILVVSLVVLMGVPEGLDLPGSGWAFVREEAGMEGRSGRSGSRQDASDRPGRNSGKKPEVHDVKQESRMDGGWMQIRTKKTPKRLCDAAEDLLDGLETEGTADYLDSGYLDLMGNLWFVLYRDHGQVRLSFVAGAEDATEIQVSMSPERLGKRMKG